MKAIVNLVSFKRLFAAFLAVVAGVAAAAQNNTQSLTYQTVFTGNTGNTNQTVDFPKFDPARGTLGAVVVKRKVSLDYGFTLVNQMSTQTTFTVTAGRWDVVNSPALPNSLSSSTTVGLGSYPLKPGESVTKAPYTILYRFLSSDSITSGVANFMGSGTVSFSYEPATYTVLKGGNIYSYQATVSDTVQFSLTYIYTSSNLLASGITDFTAKKKNEHTVALSWLGTNEQPGCRYEIYKSTDGIHFSKAGEVMGRPPGAYAFPCNTAPGENSRLWFRIAMVQNGVITGYSDTKMVDMTAAGFAGFSLYPNPSSQYINISLNEPAGNWQAEVFSSNGSLLQSDKFFQSTTLHIKFRSQMTSGIYFIRATNLQTQQAYTERLMVR